MSDVPLEKIKNARRESKYIDFKENFDPNQAGEWCEIIKDIVAMANSGGGWIIIGVRNDGSPSQNDITGVLEMDSAQITDKIFRYTGEQFSDYEVQEIEKDGYRVAAIQINGIAIPLIFTQPGSYDIGEGKQKTAFSRGTVYFRHGAKSEPGNAKDLRDFINREVEKVKKSWLSNIRKVVRAPTRYKVTVLQNEVVESSLPDATPIRLVDDASAPAYRRIDPDETYPHRQKEVVQLVNERLGDRRQVTSHDIFCVRKVHKIDKTKPNFFYKSKFATPQYNDEFINWIMEEYEKDSQFFDKAREEYKKNKTNQKMKKNPLRSGIAIKLEDLKDQ
ncbi:MAG: putative DNA binding domain-containing protein [Atribacterota bacterium]|nr:putative DNA binding domain-containing protein [Atribacterota bacterium]